MSIKKLVLQRCMRLAVDARCTAARFVAAGFIAVSFAVTCVAAESSVSSPSVRVDAYFVSAVWTGDGSVVRNAVMVVRDGKIAQIGKRGTVKVPAGAIRHELRSANVIPGMVVARTDLVAGVAPEYTLTPENLAVDGFDFYSDQQSLLKSGITTVQLSPGNQRLMPGQGAVVKLAGESIDDRILDDSSSLQIVLTRSAFSPPSIYEPPVGAVSEDRPLEPTRPQLASGLGQAIVGLRAIFQAAESDAGPMELNDGNPDGAWLDLLGDWRQENRLFRINAGSATEIRAAISLAKQFKLRFVLVNPTPSIDLAEQLKSAGDLLVGIVIDSGIAPGRIVNRNPKKIDDEPEIQLWQQLRRLHRSGFDKPIALGPSSTGDLRDLTYIVSQFRRAGLSSADVLKLVTGDAAKLLGVDERVGTLAVGKDADFVVLSGGLLQPGSQVIETFVDGESVWESSIGESGTQVLADVNIFQDDGSYSKGSISVSEGKISSVGRSSSVPAGSIIKRWPNAHVTPGFIDMNSQLGAGEPIRNRVSLNTKLGDQLVTDDSGIAYSRETGVTTVLMSSSSLPSPVVAFKLSDEPTVISDPVAIKFSLTRNLATARASLERTLAAGKQYADLWTNYEVKLAEYKTKLAAYEKEKAKIEAEKKDAAAKAKASAASKTKPSTEGKSDAEKPDAEKSKDEKSNKDDSTKTAKDSSSKTDDKSKSESDKKSDAKGDEKTEGPKAPAKPKEPRKNAALEPFRSLLAGKIPAMVIVDQDKSTEIAVELLRDKYNCNLILIGGTSTDEHDDLLRDKKVSVVLGPQLIATVDGERENLAANLAVDNIPFAFQTNASTGVRDLPEIVNYAVHHGLGDQDAIAALTATPAKILGLESIGKIAAGADADLVVFSGPPLDPASRVVAVMINGEWVYED